MARLLRVWCGCGLALALGVPSRVAVASDWTLEDNGDAIVATARALNNDTVVRVGCFTVDGRRVLSVSFGGFEPRPAPDPVRVVHIISDDNQEPFDPAKWAASPAPGEVLYGEAGSTAYIAFRHRYSAWLASMLIATEHKFLFSVWQGGEILASSVFRMGGKQALRTVGGTCWRAADKSAQ